MSLRDATRAPYQPRTIVEPLTIPLPHAAEDASLAVEPDSADSSIMLLWRNSFRLSAMHLTLSDDSDGFTGFTATSLWSFTIDRSQYISAATIDATSRMAYWLQHEVAVARQACNEGSSSITAMSLNIEAEEESPSLLIYEGVVGDVTTHCEFIAVDSLRRRLILAPRVAKRGLLIQSAVHTALNGDITWRGNPSAWTLPEIVNSGVGAGQSNFMGLIYGMQLFLTPSLTRYRNCPVPCEAQQLPTGFIFEVDDITPMFNAVPSGTLTALVRGYGVRQFPTMFAYCVSGDQTLASHPSSNKDQWIIYRIASRDLEAIQLLEPYSTELPESQAWQLEIYTFSKEAASVCDHSARACLDQVVTISAARMMVEEAIGNDLELLDAGNPM
ncbi:hypothetical protein DACRYDRAFT_112076 [Dacryopinax primogenitus]|uniref:Uncharacterized protein n=1 Tax=Dacryopinax primogenitus (strain DJM 731) TaxID=1858805 RepID=M5FV01_DACPD|nr:uncharacterized protein DACRYDRAFT_112076 [Dacryopinax primogenitus]EJT97116.1 hypothetical protein DACRYDRAFT_112076 [Dacryopinax primogenitus]